MDVQVTGAGMRPADRANLSKHVHACCTATMYMQAASLDFDMSSYRLRSSGLGSSSLRGFPSSFQASDLGADSFMGDKEVVPKTELSDEANVCPVSHMGGPAVATGGSKGDNCMRVHSTGVATHHQHQSQADAFLHGLLKRCEAFCVYDIIIFLAQPSYVYTSVYFVSEGREGHPGPVVNSFVAQV